MTDCSLELMPSSILGGKIDCIHNSTKFKIVAAFIVGLLRNLSQKFERIQLRAKQLDITDNKK